MSSVSAEKVSKRYLSDEVFERLAALILRGDFVPGSVLPSEAELAARFGASRIVVRQALHRLMERGLVRCRQGGKTDVLDPKTSGDIQVIGMLYQYADPKALTDSMREMVFDAIEKQCLQGLTMIDIASRRATDADLASLHAHALLFATAPTDEIGFDAFEEIFWRGLAQAGGNRVLIAEVDWWYRVLPQNIRGMAARLTPMVVRQGLYREVADRLLRRDHAPEYYLAVMTPWLKALPETLASLQNASTTENGTDTYALPNTHVPKPNVVTKPQLRVVPSQDLRAQSNPNEKEQ